MEKEKSGKKGEKSSRRAREDSCRNHYGSEIIQSDSKTKEKEGLVYVSHSLQRRFYQSVLVRGPRADRCCHSLIDKLPCFFLSSGAPFPLLVSFNWLIVDAHGLPKSTLPRHTKR